MKVDTARFQAYKLLLEEASRERQIGPSEVAQQFKLHPKATHLHAGVTRWRGRLDFLINRFVKNDPDKIQIELRTILRIALFEMLLSEEAVYAVINDAVELAKTKLNRGAGGLVNGVLRAVDRQRESLPRPNEKSRAGNLAIEYSHPKWMIDRWLDWMPEDELIAFLESNNRVPSFYLRPNTLLNSLEDLKKEFDGLGVSYTEVSEKDKLLLIEKLSPVLPLVKLGKCFIQDKAAGMAVELLDPKPGESVLDMCAAPGGKTIQAAMMMENQGSIVAADQSPTRIQMVKENVQKMGISIVKFHAGDMSIEQGSNFGSFDAVLLDAPCSGTGVLSKRANLRWNREPRDIEDLVDLQKRLLQNALKLVKPGGRLVYSTCSIEPDENERIIESLDNNDKMKVQEPFLRTSPHKDHCDGAFCCRIEID